LQYFIPTAKLYIKRTLCVSKCRYYHNTPSETI